MTPCQNMEIPEGTTGRAESMQQSSATPQNQDVGIGLRKIVTCSQSYLWYLLVFTVLARSHPYSLHIFEMRAQQPDIIFPT